MEKIGEQYGRLTILEVVGKTKHNKTLVLCQCTCGSKPVVTYSNLKFKTKSCGCLRAEGNTQRCSKSSEHKIKVCKDNYIKYYTENRDIILRKKVIYYADNKEAINTKKYEKHKKRMLLDLDYRLRIRIRTRIQVAFRNNYKSGIWKKYLGCSIEELRNHLESNFKEGMNWSNHGIHGWHVDHILPLCKCNVLDDDSLKIYLNYKNLQPLWAKDNLSKGGR